MKRTCGEIAHTMREKILRASTMAPSNDPAMICDKPHGEGQGQTWAERLGRPPPLPGMRFALVCEDLRTLFRRFLELQGERPKQWLLDADVLDALFQFGRVAIYFSPTVVSGLRSLVQAAEAGHRTASHLLRQILEATGRPFLERLLPQSDVRTGLASFCARECSGKSWACAWASNKSASGSTSQLPSPSLAPTAKTRSEPIPIPIPTPIPNSASNSIPTRPCHPPVKQKQMSTLIQVVPKGDCPYLPLSVSTREQEWTDHRSYVQSPQPMLSTNSGKNPR
jgi:hypothetical protein